MMSLNENGSLESMGFTVETKVDVAGESTTRSTGGEALLCPLCGVHAMTYSKAEHASGEESHFWHCQECPAVLMEFNTDKDALALIGRAGDERALAIRSNGTDAFRTEGSLLTAFCELMGFEKEYINEAVAFIIPRTLGDQVVEYLQRLARLANVAVAVQWLDVPKDHQ